MTNPPLAALPPDPMDAALKRARVALDKLQREPYESVDAVLAIHRASAQALIDRFNAAVNETISTSIANLTQAVDLSLGINWADFNLKVRNAGSLTETGSFDFTDLQTRVARGMDRDPVKAREALTTLLERTESDSSSPPLDPEVVTTAIALGIGVIETSGVHPKSNGRALEISPGVVDRVIVGVGAFFDGHGLSEAFVEFLTSGLSADPTMVLVVPIVLALVLSVLAVAAYDYLQLSITQPDTDR